MKRIVSLILALLLLVCAACAETVEGITGTISADDLTLSVEAVPLDDGVYLLLYDADGNRVSLYASLEDGVYYSDPEGAYVITLGGAPITYYTLQNLVGSFSGDGAALYSIIYGLSSSPYLHITSADISSVLKGVLSTLGTALPDSIRWKLDNSLYYDLDSIGLSVDGYLGSAGGSATVSFNEGYLRLNYERDSGNSRHYTAKLSGRLYRTEISGSADVWTDHDGVSIDAVINCNGTDVSVRLQKNDNQLSISVFALDKYGNTDTNFSLCYTQYYSSRSYYDYGLSLTVSEAGINLIEADYCPTRNGFNANVKLRLCDSYSYYYNHRYNTDNSNLYTILDMSLAGDTLTASLTSGGRSLFSGSIKNNNSSLTADFSVDGSAVHSELRSGKVTIRKPQNAANLELADLLDSIF